MRRVQVESPFAPQTLLPGDACGCERGAWCAGCSLARCGWCAATYAREQEAERNRRYLAACLADCIRRGETPYASHGLLTLPGVLDDTNPEEREKGIAAGFAMREAMQSTVFYTDLGWSSGMRFGEHDAIAQREADMVNRVGNSDIHLLEYRELGPDWDKGAA